MIQIIFIITSIILIILGSILAVFFIEVNGIRWYHYLIVSIILISTAIGAYCVIDKVDIMNDPKAIDVYRGKTTLRINYVDGIPQDTIVVFK